MLAAVDILAATPLTKRPNIYLFVIESLRADFINPEGAPHLSQFRDDHIHYDASHSNANGTHPSWFSIFHSQFSLFWKKYKTEKWAMGSPPLDLLRKWGYKVRIYTSAQLGYYGMEKVLFGQNLQLIDSYQTFHHGTSKQPWETDAEAVETLQKDLAENPELREGQVCIVFWDSTHFDYSWPKHKTAQFSPFAKEFAYFNAIQSKKNIGLIKNRYRNAVHYVDSLFGQFWQNLPNKEESIVVVTGDHAEEFFEHGHLFHNSHLVDEQTHIPLFFKLGTTKQTPPRSIACPMDIFPTIIDAISGQTLPFAEGQSLLRPSSWPYALIARFNGGRTPYEFCIHNGRNKLIAQFDSSPIFTSQELKIRSLSTCKDKAADCALNVESWIEKEFPGALDRLFGKK